VLVIWDGVSTFRGGVRLSDALDEALLLREPVDLYAFSPCLSLERCQTSLHREG
jgi:hypothetical protein